MNDMILDMPLDGPHAEYFNLKEENEHQDIKEFDEVDLSIPRGKWTKKHYLQFANQVINGVYGEELMRLCGVNRRDTIKAIWADTYDKGMVKEKIKWQFNTDTGVRPIPSKLKIMKDGALRISSAQFERVKFKVDKDDKFKIEKSDENTLLLKKIVK